MDVRKKILNFLFIVLLFALFNWKSIFVELSITELLERCFHRHSNASQELVVIGVFDNNAGDDWRHNSVDGFRTVNH